MQDFDSLCSQLSFFSHPATLGWFSARPPEEWLASSFISHGVDVCRGTKERVVSYVLKNVCVCALQDLLEHAGIPQVLAVIFGVVQSSTAKALCGNFALKVVRCGAETDSCAFLLPFVVGGAPALGFATLRSDNVLLEAKLVVNPVADPGRMPPPVGFRSERWMIVRCC